MKLQTLLFLTAFLLGSQACRAETKHFVIVCPTEPAYQTMANQAATLIKSGLENHNNFMTIISNDGCIDDHWKPGDSPYKILDTDGDYVVITNGTHTGYMNRSDYDQFYVVGLPAPSTPNQ